MRPWKRSGIRRGGAARLFAGHGMSAQKLGVGQGLARQIYDGALGAAGVGDQRAGTEQGIEVAEGIENASDGLRQENEVRVGDGVFERGAAIDGTDGESVRDGTRGTDTGDGAAEARFAQGESEGGADQASADDDDVFHVSWSYLLRTVGRRKRLPHKAK